MRLRRIEGRRCVVRTPFAGTNQIRFLGSAAARTLSARGAPLSQIFELTAILRPRACARLGPMPEIPSASQRVLDAAARKGVTLDIVTFDESTHTAEDAARAVGAGVGQIVKSLVFVADRDEGPEPCLVLVSGANRVDVSLLAAVLTEPRMRRATADEARAFTGYTIGGIPPFGHGRAIRTVMDPDLGRFATIWAAAGTANTVFALTPHTLRVLTNAIVSPIAAAPVRPVEPTTPEQPLRAPSGA